MDEPLVLLRLIRGVAKGFRADHPGRWDMRETESAAGLAVARALLRFRPELGVPLKAYLTQQIRFGLREFDATGRGELRVGPQRKRAGGRWLPDGPLPVKFQKHFGHGLAAPQPFNRVEFVDRVEAIAKTLDAEKAVVFRARWLDGATVEEAGALIGVCGSRASQILNQAYRNPDVRRLAGNQEGVYANKRAGTGARRQSETSNPSDGVK